MPVFPPSRPRLGRRPWTAARARLVGLSLVFAAACVGANDAAAPAGGSSVARVAVAASVGRVAASTADPATLEVAVAYLHAAGDSVPMGVQRFTLTDADTQQLPMIVDLATCLGDPARRAAASGSGATPTCVLRLDLALQQGGAVLDREAVVPVYARAGQTVTVGQPVALYTVATVAVAPVGGAAPVAGGAMRLALDRTLALVATARDATGQIVTSRTPRWSSDNPSVATVDSAGGLVTPHSPGRATITALVGGRSGAIAVGVVPAPAAVTVAVAGGFGAGTVTSQPAGIACQVAGGQSSGACTFTFAADSAVTLTAAPAAGAVFATWSGDCAGAGGLPTCVLTPATPRTASVTFVAFRTLSVGLTGNGGGAVRSEPAGIACALAAGPLAAGPLGAGVPGTTSGSCAATYLDGTSVTLRAAPAPGQVFAGWGGACASAGAAAACTVTLDQARSVTASFQPRTAVVTLALSGSAGGSVLMNGAVVCTLPSGGGSVSCPVAVPVGTAASFTAQPASGAQFGGWAGPCLRVAGCAFTVTGDVMLGATFVPVPVTVRANTGLRGTGTVTAYPAGINCAISLGDGPTACTASVPSGSSLSVTATSPGGLRVRGVDRRVRRHGGAVTGTHGIRAPIGTDAVRPVGLTAGRRRVPGTAGRAAPVGATTAA